MTARAALPELTDHLGYWLRLVSNHVSQAFARKLDARGVTVAEWVILRELHDVEEWAPSRLAEKLDLTRGAITKLADRLIAKSLLTRTADSQDARAQTLALTKAGRELVPRLAALADQNEAEFFGHLSVRERRALQRTLQDLAGYGNLKSVPVS